MRLAHYFLENQLNKSSFILLEAINQSALHFNSLFNSLKENGDLRLLVSRRNIDRHSKEGVILYANSVMSCSAVTGHIHIPMPRRRPEIPFKERRIDLFLSSKAKVQR